MSEAALSVFGTAQASFGYSLGAPLLTSSSTATAVTRSDLIDPFTMTLAAGGSTVTINDPAPRAIVRQGNLLSQFFIGRNGNTAAGLLTAGFSFTDTNPVSQRIDLAALMRAGADNSGTRPDFDLTGFATLPAHVRSASIDQAVYVGLQAFDDRPRPAPFNADLPNPLALQDDDSGMALEVLFDGVYTVAVQPEPFATQADFQRASDWVAANLRQFNDEVGVTCTVNSLQPVPEPASAALLVAGLALFAPHIARRRRRGVSAP